MPELIGIRECARRLNVSDTAVHKAIKTQRIFVAGHTEKSNRPLVEWPKVADDWVANTDPLKRVNAGNTGTSARRVAYSAEPPVVKMETRQDIIHAPPDDTASTDDSDDEITHNTSTTRSRQISEAYKAKLTKLEFEEKSGRLVEIENVKAQAFKSARSIRDALMNIPDRCAAELAAETDAARVHTRLSREIREILESLADAAE